MLGSAFQKVNFLRDLGSDIKDRGRIYIPDIDLSGVIEEADKKKLENNISEEFQIALAGIKQLPEEFIFGVYTAYVYYLSLFKKLRMKNIKELMSYRVRISNFKKMVLLFLSFFRVKILNNL